MNEREQVLAVLTPYGLEGVLRSYEVFEAHATLSLQGIVSLARLDATPGLRQVLADLGIDPATVRGLYARVTTADGLMHVQAHHPEVRAVVREAVTRAAQEVWAMLTLHADAGPVPEDDLPSVEPVDLRSLTRAERLDRARALTGRLVYDTHDVRDAQAAQHQMEHALLHFPPPRNAAPEEEIPDEEWQIVMQQEAIMRAEGTLYPDQD